MEKLGNRRRFRWQAALVFFCCIPVGWCEASAKDIKAKQKKGREQSFARTLKSDKNDSTIQTASPLVHSSLADSLSKNLAMHSPHQSGKETEQTALPIWMQALNEPAKQDSNHVGDGRDPLRISELINAHNKEIKAIYQKFLKQWPNLEGKLSVRIHLHPCGTVAKVEVAESTLNQPRFESSILDAIRRWRDFGICRSKKIMIYRQQYLFGD